MRNSYYKTALIICLFFISKIGYTQTGEIKIKFIGNCGLYLTDGTRNLYVDFPYKSGAHKYMKYDATEIEQLKPNSIFLFTHKHTDHYSKKLVRRCKKKLGGKVFGNWNTQNLNELNDVAAGFSIQAYKTSHMFTFKHYSYVITWHGKKIYVSGDTGDIEVVGKLSGIDWAFVNPWLYMNALNAKVKIDAEKFGLFHLYPNQKIDGQIPEYLLVLKNQGEVISIPY